MKEVDETEYDVASGVLGAEFLTFDLFIERWLNGMPYDCSQLNSMMDIESEVPVRAGGGLPAILEIKRVILMDTVEQNKDIPNYPTHMGIDWLSKRRISFFVSSEELLTSLRDTWKSVKDVPPNTEDGASEGPALKLVKSQCSVMKKHGTGTATALHTQDRLLGDIYHKILGLPVTALLNSEKVMRMIVLGDEFDEMVSGTQRKYYMLGGKGGVGKPVVLLHLLFKDLTGGTLVPVDRPLSPLFALEINPEKAREEFRDVSKKNGGTGVKDFMDGMGELGELLDTPPPGLDEAIAISKVIQFLESQEYNMFTRIVFDTAPTGHTLRLLSLPDFLDASIGKILKLRQKISSAASAIKNVFGQEETRQDAFDKLEKLRERMIKVHELFRDANSTEFFIVTSYGTEPVKAVGWGLMIATDLRKICVIKATSSPTPSANMEGSKDEDKSDVYSTNMTEAMGAVLTYRHELGMNYNFIRPDLIVGSCLQTPEDVDKLRSIDVKTIFCLQQDSDLEYFSVDISAIREYASTFNDIQHLRAEISRDFDGTDLRLRLPAVVSKLHKAINRNGGVTYIHCTAGLGRAPATALAYMFWVQGYKLNNALSLLLRNRKCFPNVDAIKSATADILTGLKKRSITLTWNGDDCSTVAVSGLDVGWDQRLPLNYEEKHGSWILHRELLEGRYEYKYIVDGEWMTNAYEPVTPANKDGHINNYIQVVDKDPESISAALWKRLGADDFDLTTNEREIIKQFLDEYPDDDDE
ncbi:hypothetical protein E3N88_03108 [Mikania micrantha]|uniref:Dual specificity protein phosphatase 4 n=1 Tax=Mikania micrantha TaxID=192012 RepID=A0A5N6Q5T4_9ASTR|nr:hypothetical protein E3N88_03108 [Mikania micrantha]